MTENNLLKFPNGKKSVLRKCSKCCYQQKDSSKWKINENKKGNSGISNTSIYPC